MHAYKKSTKLSVFFRRVIKKMNLKPPLNKIYKINKFYVFNSYKSFTSHNKTRYF